VGKRGAYALAEQRLLVNYKYLGHFAL